MIAVYLNNGSCREAKTFYFLAFGRLYEIQWRDGTWETFGAFRCTHCKRSLALDLINLGINLMAAGWDASDIELIKDLADTPRKEEGRFDPLPHFLQAFAFHERYLSELPHELRADERRRYYRKHLWPRKEDTFWW